MVNIKNKNYLFKILVSKYSGLSNKKKLIARYILSECEEAAFLSADEVATKLDMATSTIVRFIKELGFSGYPEFKNLLKDSILFEIRSAGPLKKAKIFKKTSNNIIHSSLQQDLGNIQKLVDIIDYGKIKKFIEIILKSKNIFIIANRASFSVGHFFYYELKKILNNVVFMENYDHGIYDQLRKIKKQDVVIFISFPRYSNLTLGIFNFIKNKGISALTITDSYISPFFKKSDITLLCPYGGYSFLTSQVASMALVNAILSEIFDSNREEAIANLEEEERILFHFDVVNLKK